MATFSNRATRTRVRAALGVLGLVVTVRDPWLYETGGPRRFRIAARFINVPDVRLIASRLEHDNGVRLKTRVFRAVYSSGRRPGFSAGRLGSLSSRQPFGRVCVNNRGRLSAAGGGTRSLP